MATEEMRARWPGWDSEAIAFLEAHGFVLLPDTWTWTTANGPVPWESLTERERDAITYLVDEFDYGGLAR